MTGDQQKKLRLLLTPSWTSGFLAITFGVLVLIGPRFFLQYGTFLREGVLGSQLYLSQSLPAQTISNDFLANAALGNIVLALLWAGVGGVLYFSGVNLVSSIREITKLSKTLEYAGTARKSLVRETSERLALRILALVCWWLLLRLLIYKLVPSSIAASHSMSTLLGSPNNWIHVVVMASSCVLCMHALTVTFRLILLRPRLGLTI